MTPRPVALLQCSLCVFFVHLPGFNSEHTHLSLPGFSSEQTHLSEQCVASVDHEYGRSQLSLLQTSVQVALDTLPLERYDYGFPAATYGDSMANQFVHWDDAGPYIPASYTEATASRYFLSSRPSWGEARSADGYINADANTGVPRNALMPAWLTAAEVAMVKEHRILDMPAVRNGKQILDPSRVDRAAVATNFVQLVQEASTRILESTMDASLWMLLFIGIGCGLSCLVYALGVREEHHFHHQHHHPHDHYLGEDVMFTFRLVNGIYWLILFIVGGFWMLWTFNIIQPILKQAITMVYVMVVGILASIMVVCIIHLQVRSVVKKHLKPMIDSVHRVHDKIEKFEDTVEDLPGVNFFKGHSKNANRDNENTMKGRLPDESGQKQMRCCS